MGKQSLVRELPKKRRRTEVSVPCSGSGGAVGGTVALEKIDLCSCTRDAISIRILRVRALLSGRV